MALTTRKQKNEQSEVDPDQLYTAWDSFFSGPTDITVRAGTTLRGSHPAVQNHAWLFMPAGTPDDEIAARRARQYATEEQAARGAHPEPERVHVPQPVTDPDDLVVATRDVFVGAQGGLSVGPQGEALTAAAGTRLRRNHPLVKARPDAFVSVTNDIRRDRAVVALQQVSNTAEDGNVRTIHAGQWADIDDPLVHANPHVFERPRVA